MNAITIPSSYIQLVQETRDAQKAYFEAVIQAKKTNTGEAWKERNERLRESKSLEATLDQQTSFYLSEIHGRMTADEAIAALRAQVDGDLEDVRKEVKHG